MTHKSTDNISNTNEKKTGQKKADMITSIILIAFSAMIITQALSMKIMLQYAPGPGMFPLAVGVIIAVLSTSLLIDSLNPKIADKESKFKNKAGIVSSIKMFIGLLAYALLINVFGYLIMTFLLVCYVMMIVEKSSLKTTLLTAAGVTLIIFLIFQVGLSAALPKGLLGF